MESSSDPFPSYSNSAFIYYSISPLFNPTLIPPIYICRNSPLSHLDIFKQKNNFTLIHPYPNHISAFGKPLSNLLFILSSPSTTSAHYKPWCQGKSFFRVDVGTNISISETIIIGAVQAMDGMKCNVQKQGYRETVTKRETNG